MRKLLIFVMLSCSMAVIGQVKFDKYGNAYNESKISIMESDGSKRYVVGSALSLMDGSQLIATPGISNSIFYPDSNSVKSGNAHKESRSLMFKTDSLVSFSLPLIVNNKGEIVPMPSVQDTVKVIMLATNRTDINKPVQLMQIEGYSVTPKYVFNVLPRAYYLNIHKQPIPDDVIVWMSIQR